MLRKVFRFLVHVAINGVLSIFIAAAFYLVLAFVFAFVAVPISFIVGDEVANRITDFAGNDLGYKFVYAIVFILIVMNDIRDLKNKAVPKQWKQKKSA